MICMIIKTTDLESKSPILKQGSLNLNLKSHLREIPGQEMNGAAKRKEKGDQ